MKCILDTTVNLKQLITPGSEKLLISVNGRPLLEQHFEAMSQAGVTSVFVLLEVESSARAGIARTAMKYGYNPTFLEVDAERIGNRKSIMVAEPYMKEAFIYWPVNRIMSASMIKSMVKHPVTSHQVLSFVYTGKEHPQIDKNSIFKIDYSLVGNNGKSSSESAQTAVRSQESRASTGYDVGVYKCGAIIFKLIEKVSQNRPLSWNRIQAALTRAGRGLVIASKNESWVVIENNRDLETLEQLQALQTVNEIDLNTLDKPVLCKTYSRLLPKLENLNFLKSQGALLCLLGIFISSLAMAAGYWLLSLLGGALTAGFILLYPLMAFISKDSALTTKLDPIVLSIIRILAILMLSIASFNAFGFGIWMVGSLLLLGAEGFFVWQPVIISEPKVEQIVGSYLIHAGWLLLAACFILPTLSLIIFGLLSLGILLTKGQQYLLEKKIEREEMEQTEDSE